MMALMAQSKDKQSGLPSHLLITYGFFLFSAAAVWHLVADGAFSAILTLAVMVQCLGAALLSIQVLTSGSVAGISAQAVKLDVLAICLRLSSTLWLNGYLPVDASGDFAFQAFDICSLCILVWLLQQILMTRQDSYQKEADSMQTSPFILGSLILAVLFHGNMNGRPLFDMLWMAGLFISAVSVVPQLWLITQTGGSVEALTSHYIAAMAVSRILSGIFMWHAHDDITCYPWIGDFNHAGWVIMAAHFVHLILLADFGYYYAKAVIACGLNCRIHTMDDCNV